MLKVSVPEEHFEVVYSRLHHVTKIFCQFQWTIWTVKNYYY